MNNNVIIGGSRHAKQLAYHTDICFQVYELKRKSYVSKAEAERRGMTECEYCSGEFSTEGLTGSKLSYKLQKADPSEVRADD
jgi:hypothetical protein